MLKCWKPEGRCWWHPSPRVPGRLLWCCGSSALLQVKLLCCPRAVSVVGMWRAWLSTGWQQLFCHLGCCAQWCQKSHNLSVPFLPLLRAAGRTREHWASFCLRKRLLLCLTVGSNFHCLSSVSLFILDRFPSLTDANLLVQESAKGN